MYNYYVAIILHQITNCIYYQFNVVKPIINHPPVITINLGKLQYFTNLNSSAIWGSFPLLTMIPVRENSEVVIIYPDKWVVNMALFSPPAPPQFLQLYEAVVPLAALPQHADPRGAAAKLRAKGAG